MVRSVSSLPGETGEEDHAGQATPSAKDSGVLTSVTVIGERGTSSSSEGSADGRPPRSDAASMDGAADRKRAKLERLQTLRHAGLATDPEQVYDPETKVEEQLALAEEHVPWIKRKGNMVKVVLNVLSVLLIASGIVLATPVSPEQLYAFRWPIFFGAVIPLFYISRSLTSKIYHWIEVGIYKEPLFHFSSLKKSTKTLMFFLLLLIWYFLVFEILWCRHTMYNGVCREPAYIEVTRTMMKIILCCVLGSLANFLAAVVAKYISTHFLKSTHFKKLNQALEKEFYLKLLSDPKLRRPDERHHKASDDPPSAPAFMKQSKNSAPNLLEVLTEGSPMVPADGGKGQDQRKQASQRGSYEDLPSLSQLNLESARRSTDDGSSTGSSTPTSKHTQEHDHNRLMNQHEGDDLELGIGKSALEAVQMEFSTDENDVDAMTEEEFDRLRTAVVIKTSSAMMRQHKFRSKEEKEAQLQRTREFAKLLFYTIRGSDSRRPYFTYRDVKLFFPNTVDGKRDARSAFGLFAGNRSAKVYTQQAVDTVLNIYKDRSNISASLSNTDTMIRSLQGCLAAGLHFLFLAFYLLIWRIDIMAGFSAFSATVLALSFIFGNSIRNLFESMLFLFVEHPYDIGDWVEIDGKCYEVIKISLMNTTFLATGMIRTVIPNATLIPKEVRNMSRLDTHLEIMTIQVDFGMAEIVKDEIRKRLVELTKQHSNDYMANPIWVVYTGVDANMKANLLVLWAYACAPADWDRKHPARDRAINMVTGIVAKHHPNGVNYTYNHRLANGIPADLMSSTAVPRGGGGGNEGTIGDLQAAAAALHSAQQMQQHLSESLDV